MSNVRRVVRVAVAVVGLSTVCAAMGQAATRALTAPEVLQLRFRVAARGVDYVYTSGSYVLLSVHRGTRYALIDDRRDARTSLTKADGCTVNGFAAPWILFGFCPRSATLVGGRLYNVRTRRWGRLNCDVCGDGEAWSYQNAMGSDWLWFDMPYGCPGAQYGNPCSAPVFVRIPSGRNRSWQPSGDRVADLDSPTLVRTTCLQPPPGLIGPFSAPSAPLVTSLVWGSNLALVSQNNNSGTGYTLILEGCGSEPQIPLLSASTGVYSWMVSANPRSVVWWVAGKEVMGVFVPGLRRFRVPLPVIPNHRLGVPTGALNLTSTGIYVLDSTGRVWTAPLLATSRPG